MTWNPVTGCLHGCDYCYARKIVKRFNSDCFGNKELHELDEIVTRADDTPEPIRYPFGFDPTLHRYRLGEPQKIKKLQNIFVCSMADLFGEWVPDEWIEAVFEACGKAPQHRYLFLTKNPERYDRLPENTFRMVHLKDDQELWMGCTINNRHNMADAIETRSSMRCFISIEPLQTEVSDIFDELRNAERYIKWVIVGAETGKVK
jgi:protein gp37